MPTPVELGSWSLGSTVGGRGRVRRREVRAAGGNRLDSRSGTSADRRVLLRVNRRQGGRGLEVVRSRRSACGTDRRVQRGHLAVVDRVVLLLEVVRGAEHVVRVVRVSGSLVDGSRSAGVLDDREIRDHVRGSRVDRRSTRRYGSRIRTVQHVRDSRSGVRHVHPRSRRGAGHLGDQEIGGGAVGDDRGLVRRGSSVQRKQRGGSDDRDHRHERSGPKTGRHACPPCTYNVRSKRTYGCGRVAPDRHGCRPCKGYLDYMTLFLICKVVKKPINREVFEDFLQNMPVLSMIIQSYSDCHRMLNV